MMRRAFPVAGAGGTASVMRVVHALWSVVAWSLATVIQIAFALCMLPLLLFRRFEDLQGGWPSTLIGAIPLLTLSRRHVVWDRRFDPRRVSVFVSNHTSMLDGHVMVHALPHPFCGVENAAHLAVPGYGWIMRMANAIPVPRGAGRIDALVGAARDRAGRGISVLAFPEAHRTLDGRVRPFRTGVFVAARDAGLPVVPVAVRGMYHVLPKGTWVVTPGCLEVYIGPTLETAGKTDAELETLAEGCRAAIAAWVESKSTATPHPFVPPRRAGKRASIPAEWPPAAVGPAEDAVLPARLTAAAEPPTP